jgi:RsiW-degrading membrane proteinase PrsW (M82 family)
MPVYSLTILAAAALVVWVYHQDSHEREPWYGVFVALLSGFVAMFLLGIADDFAIKWLRLSGDRIIPKAAVIALIEEGGKLFTILALAQILLRADSSAPSV